MHVCAACACSHEWCSDPTAATPTGLKWNVLKGAASSSVSWDGTEAHHGYASLRVSYEEGSGFSGASNRGIGNEGLYLRGGKEYEGYL